MMPIYSETPSTYAQFKCPHCQVLLRVYQIRSGVYPESIDCIHCGKPVLVYQAIDNSELPGWK